MYLTIIPIGSILLSTLLKAFVRVTLKLIIASKLVLSLTPIVSPPLIPADT